MEAKGYILYMGGTVFVEEWKECKAQKGQEGGHFREGMDGRRSGGLPPQCSLSMAGQGKQAWLI